MRELSNRLNVTMAPQWMMDPFWGAPPTSDKAWADFGQPPDAGFPGQRYYTSMFRRRRVVQNEIVARRMTKFFESLADEHQSEPKQVARTYGEFLWDRGARSLVDEKKLSRSRFYVGLSTGRSSQNFEQITKRTSLISDTLLLSHDWAGKYHELSVQYVTATEPPPPPATTIRRDKAQWLREELEYSHALAEAIERSGRKEMYGMHCPSLPELGQWILDAEPLLKAGLAWYLPSYSTSRYTIVNGFRQEPVGSSPAQVKAIDYLIRDGRAVDASGSEPIKSQLVRPVLRAELPFIDRVSLRDFSKITIEEFASYSCFRNFLRQSFLELDESLNAVQSDRELTKLGLQINDQVRAAHSEMQRTRRTRAISASGAAIATVGAILVAVYGPALQSAIGTIGAGGGLWGIIQAAADNTVRTLREDKWYYVWVLAKKSNTL